jgi:hypothetical protein
MWTKIKLGTATYYQKPAVFLLRVVSVMTFWGEGQDRMVAELEALHSLLRSLLEAAQQAAPRVTFRTPDMAPDMTRHDMAPRGDSLAQSMRSLLEAAQQAARPVTPRTWREMTWRERIRWLRKTG